MPIIKTDKHSHVFQICLDYSFRTTFVDPLHRRLVTVRCRRVSDLPYPLRKGRYSVTEANRSVHGIAEQGGSRAVAVRKNGWQLRIRLQTVFHSGQMTEVPYVGLGCTSNAFPHLLDSIASH